MINLHKIILEEYEIEALCLLGDWEKLQIRTEITRTIGFLHLDVSVSGLFQSALG